MSSDSFIKFGTDFRYYDEILDDTDFLNPDFGYHIKTDNPITILMHLLHHRQYGGDLYISGPEKSEFIAESMLPFLISQDNLLGYIFLKTSGTTGNPKTVKYGFNNIIFKPHKTPKSNDGWLLTYLPTTYAGLQVILTAYYSGGSLYAPKERTITEFAKLIKNTDIKNVSGTPTFWRSILMLIKPNELEHIKQITLGGEAADQATIDRIKAACPKARITHIYASTETGVAFAVNDGKEGFPAAWLEKPVQGIELRIVDELLQIKTKNSMVGYASEHENPISEDGWIKTKDKCEIVGDRVFILGREDSMINVAGSKVYPLEVEKVLLSIPQVQEVKVYGIKNPISGQLLGADIVLHSDAPVNFGRQQILEAIPYLPKYKIPQVIKFVESIAVKDSGKKA